MRRLTYNAGANKARSMKRFLSNRYMYLMLAGAIHAFSLGPILANGITFVHHRLGEANVEAPISPSGAAAWQFAVFYGTNLLLSAWHYIRGSCGLSASDQGHTLVAFGMLLLTVGHSFLLYSKLKPAEVYWVWVPFVGFGGGVAYWTTMIQVSRQFPIKGSEHRRFELSSLSLGWLAIAPTIFLSVYPQFLKMCMRYYRGDAEKSLRLTYALLTSFTGVIGLIYLALYILDNPQLTPGDIKGGTDAYESDDEETSNLISGESSYSRNASASSRMSFTESTASGARFARDILRYPRYDPRATEPDRLITEGDINSWGFLFFLAASVGVQTAFFIPVNRLPEYMAKTGAPQKDISAIVTIFGLSSLGGRALASVVASLKLPIPATLCISAAAGGLGGLIPWLLHAKVDRYDYATSRSTAIVSGVFLGVVYGLMPMMTKRYASCERCTPDEKEASHRHAVAMTRYGMALFAGAVIYAAVLHWMTSHEKVVLMGVVAMGISTFFFMLSASSKN